MRRSIPLFYAALLLALLAAPATAQSGRSSISGRVIDSNGAVVATATVTLRQLSNKSERTASTDASGAFRFDNLSGTEYRLTVSGEGFSPASQAIALKQNEKRDVELVMQAGAIAV
ncbi:MAG TPA: carboxypeptidase-like regulatory domain-containing protein, partial [Pyrinomonadaceae bacterium]|nr:carboxypeptidase-like regulatory domain-containing protein [Pyrinomonadaceae bacterium]